MGTVCKVCDIVWTVEIFCEGENTIYRYKDEEIGMITVLDRLTGFGNGLRDTETGYRDLAGKFWLASGMFDIRDHGDLSISDAIDLIKTMSNTCIGV